MSCINCDFQCLHSMGIEEGEVAQVKADSRIIFYKKNESVFKQGAFVSHISFLKKGLIKLVMETPNKKSVIVKFVSSGEFLGFASLDDENSYPYSAIALKDAEVCIIQKEVILNLLQKNNTLACKLIEWHNKNTRFLFEKLSFMSTSQMHGRLAGALLYLAQPKLAEEDVYSHINRRDIAELAAMSSESMVKLMSELKADKIIEVQRKKIQIKDVEMLERLSRIG